MKMNIRTVGIIGAALLLILVAAVGFFFFSGREDPNVAVVEEVVTAFGERLKSVPLTAGPEQAAMSIRNEYAGYATRELLDRWAEDPQKAPGRLTSSPWPVRIEVHAVRPMGESYFVEGTVVYLTSDTIADEKDALFEHVVLVVVETDDGWRISDYTVQEYLEGTLKEEESS